MRRPRPDKQRLDYIRDLRASSPYDVDDAVFGDAGIMVDDLLVEIDSVTDEYKRRIDKVIALAEKVESAMDRTGSYTERAYGVREAYRAVKSLLAPKQEARFTVGSTEEGWDVVRVGSHFTEPQPATFRGPDAEKHAREFAAKLNGASDE